MDRTTLSTGTPWEKAVSYSRAVRVGRHLFVSGTTASNADGTTVSPGDPYAQARFILQKIQAALLELGADRTHVVRTRMFVTDIRHWETFGKAHGEFFAGICPAATMVEVRALVNPDHLIEIEVDAMLPDEASRDVMDS